VWNDSRDGTCGYASDGGVSVTTQVDGSMYGQCPVCKMNYANMKQAKFHSHTQVDPNRADSHTYPDIEAKGHQAVNPGAGAVVGKPASGKSIVLQQTELLLELKQAHLDMLRIYNAMLPLVRDNQTA
jgi:hypothetical protein